MNRKPIDEKGGHHALPATLEAPATYVIPPAPEGADVERWEAVWSSPVAAVLDPVTDYEPMRRLFELYSLERRLAKAVSNYLTWLENWTPGDTSEPLDYDPKIQNSRMQVTSEIRQLEQTLGVTPRGRLVIGAAVAAVNKAAEQKAVRDDADD